MEVSEKTLASIVGTVLGFLGIGKWIGERFNSYGKKKVEASRDVMTRKRQVRLSRRVRRLENGQRDIKGTLGIMAVEMKNLNDNFGKGR